VDPLHRSWADNSTGPYGENTEEAEVGFAMISDFMIFIPFHVLSLFLSLSVIYLFYL
jgi:hypothetical protein